jgi:hypothetical protein
MRLRIRFALPAVIALCISPEAFAGGDWPAGPNKAWFQNLERPDNHLNPLRDHNSRFCCGVGDTVKTKFKVERGDEVEYLPGAILVAQ